MAPIIVIITPLCILLGKIAHPGGVRGTCFVIAIDIFVPAAEAVDKESASSSSHHPTSSLAWSPSWGVSYWCHRHCQRETHHHHLLVIAVASSHVLFGVISLPGSIGSHHVIIAIRVLVAASAAAAKEGCIVIVIVITGSPCILLRAVTLPGSVRWPHVIIIVNIFVLLLLPPPERDASSLCPCRCGKSLHPDHLLATIILNFAMVFPGLIKISALVLAFLPPPPLPVPISRIHPPLLPC